VARGTQFSMGILAKEKYFSHSLSQLTGSSQVQGGKSSLGVVMDRLNCFRFSLWLCGLCVPMGIVVWCG
jgi:hypothetical protein